jgi:hypothetical protein
MSTKTGNVVAFLEWSGKLFLTIEQEIAVSVLSLVAGLSLGTKRRSFAYYKEFIIIF